MPDTPNFLSDLSAAVAAARAKLGTQFSLTADRAGAYLDVAKVLRGEASALASTDPTNSTRYLETARMLEEQAEITTYSGENGTAAIAGNLQAKIANPDKYDSNLPLDQFSYEIDDAILGFIETAVSRNDTTQLSKNNILAVDGLVWDSHGMVQYFPGDAIGYTFTADTSSAVWAHASEEQIARLSGGGEHWSIGDPNELFLSASVAAAIGTSSLGKTPADFGFNVPAVIDNLPPGETLTVVVNGRQWLLEKSDDNIVTIKDNNALIGDQPNPTYGHIAYVNNNTDLAQGWTATLADVGEVLAPYFPGATMFAGFVEPGSDTLSPSAIDAIKNFLGADHGQLGVRYLYGAGGSENVQTVEQLIEATRSAAGGTVTSTISLVDDPNNPGAKLIVGKSLDPVTGNTKLVSLQLGVDENGKAVVESATTVSLTPEGTLASAEVTQDGETRLLNLESLADSNAQLEAYAKALAAATPTPQPAYDAAGNLLGVKDDLTFGSNEEIARGFLTAKVDAQGKLTLSGHTTTLIAYDKRSHVGRYDVDAGVDSFGRPINKEWDYNLVSGQEKYTGIQEVTDGAVTVTTDDHGPTTIKLTNSPIKIDFIDAADILANTFGRLIAGDNVLTQTLTSAALTTIASNFGDVLNTLAFDGGTATASNLSHAFDGMGQEFINNLQSAGIGAVSSYLTAQLVDALGVNGIPGELLNTEAGQVITTILTNAAAGDYIFKGLTPASLANTAGSFAGTKLAESIANWDEVGEQIGAQIGSALGASIGTAIPVPFIGTAIGAFFGDLIGGFIGGLFTGKPESGAILGYDSESGRFAVTSAWKQDGGKKAVATQLANTAALSLNGILDAIGGDLINAESVDAGSYGMRAKSFVYWQDGTESDNRIKFATASDLVEYGVLQAASQMKILGGDIITKRAFYNTVDKGPQTTLVTVDGPDDGDGAATKVDFGLDELVGNLTIAQRLDTYLANSASINALMIAQPDSAFTAEWLLTLSQASDLGLLKRGAHDWDGGFSYLLGQDGIDARAVSFQFTPLQQAGNGERRMSLAGALLEDKIDSGSQTIIQGGANDDVLSAQSGGARQGADQGSQYHIANVFHGGAGDDLIRAGNSGDDLFGDDGNDTLIGGLLDDWLLGGDGDDLLDAGGGSGNVLVGGFGDDRLRGADGVSSDPMNSGSDWLEGGAGDDQLSGRGGDDYLAGGQGDDIIDGGKGSDTIIYRAGDGADEVQDSGTDQSDRDVVDFDAAIQSTDVTVLARSTTVDLSLVVRQNIDNRIDLRGETLTPTQGFEEVSFADASWGKDDLADHTVFAKTSGQSITGTSASETLVGTYFDDNLSGGGGNDTLQGGFGSDTYHFNTGDGVVTIRDLGFAEDLDSLVFGTGITQANITVSHDIAAPQDLVITVGSNGDKVILPGQLLTDGTHSIEEVRFQDGTSLTLRDLENLVSAAPFTTGADYRLGFDANDTFDAGAGSDTLAGGLGDDRLIGSDGADTYLYNAGDGSDEISEGYEGYLSTLVLGAGITPDEIRLTRDPVNTNDLIVSFANHSGSILLEGQYYTDQNGIDTIQFADGSSWNRATIDAKMLSQAQTDKADFIYAPQTSSSIAGGAGNDHIYGNNGSDTIAGGAGDDVIDGGTGADTYLYNVGDGNDQITEGYEGYTSTLVFGAGISASDLIVERDAANSNNLRIRFTDHAGSILLYAQYYGPDRGIDVIQFADGTSWNHADLDAHMIAQASSEAGDIIYAGYNGNSINGGGGNDAIYGGAGSDTLVGGTGDDDLQGGTGADTYVYNLGDGNDRIVEGYEGSTSTLVLGAGITQAMLQFERDALNPDDLRITFAGHDGSILVSSQYTSDGQRGLDVLQFADGSTLDRAAIQTAGSATTVTNVTASGSATINGSTGRDHIVGSNANETILAGAGDDYMEGGNGDDTYVFNSGDGFDEIHESSGADKVKFGAGILSSNVTVSEYRDLDGSVGLMLSVNGTSDRLYVYAGLSRGEGRIEQVVFDDGTTWTDADLRTRAYANASTAGADLIAGSLLADSINAGDGNDQILDAGQGNDTLVGGKGNDYLGGGQDDDTYIFNLGDGADTIGDNSGTDVLKFGAGINPEDIIITPRTSGDAGSVGVQLSIRGTDDSVYILDDLNNGYRRIETIQFDNGTVWSDAQLRQSLMDLQVTDGADYIEGSTLAESLNGGAGDDHLLGSWGNDTLAGGKGNDYLDGGTDSDTFLFNRGDGTDTIADQAGDDDTIRFGDGIAASDILFERYTGSDGSTGAILSIKGTQDKIYLPAVWSNGYHHIEHFQFADGSSWTLDQFFNLLNANTIGGATISSSMGDDDIVGSKDADTLSGMGGDDVLRGGMGSDTYKFAKGDGYDTLSDPTDAGSTDKLVLTGVASTDVKLITSPTDPDDVIVYIDDDNMIYLDGQKASSTSGIDEIDFADGTVWHRADIDAKIAAGQGTSGADRIIGTLFADTLNGGTGNDTLIGSGGADTYTYAAGDGDDVIQDDATGTGTSSQDLLSLGAGFSQAELRLSRAADGAIIVSFAAHAGSVTLRGAEPGGRSGVQLIKFADGSSVTMDALRQANIAAQETAGNDTVDGFETADTLAGGAGNDTLKGHGGADTYQFNLGDGADTIVDGGDGKTNVLILGSGISAATIRLSRTAAGPNDLVLTIPASQGTITLKDQFAGNGLGLEEIHFADGTIWHRADLMGLLLAQPATTGDDFLIGADGNDTIDGLAGSDFINGGAGGDVLTGSGGDDQIYGGAGADSLSGGDGNDTLSGDEGADTLDGGNGTDVADYSFSLDSWTVDLAAGHASIQGTGSSTVETITSFEGAIGGMGSDSITGTSGDNYIVGGAGEDTLIGADGNDQFVVEDDDGAPDSIDGGSGSDTIRATADDVVIGLKGLSGVETITADGHQGVTIQTTDDADTLDLGAVSLNGIGAILLGAGNDTLTMPLAPVSINAGDGDDVIKYSGVHAGAGDTIDGGAGTDKIVATANDTVIRIASAQNIEAIDAGTFTNVTLQRTDADDIMVWTGITVTGTVKIDLAGGNDNFTGSAQADVVSGGLGNDTLAAGAGDDTYIFNSGDGQDLITDTGGNDIVQLGTGITAADVSVFKADANNDFILLFAGNAGDRITLDQAASTAANHIEQVKFADGTIWSYSDLTTKATGTLNIGTAGADTLNGSGAAEAIDGAGGNDVLDGGAGNDTLTGGVGNDTVKGSDGDDVYVWNIGDGDDVFFDVGASYGGTDTIRLGSGILPSDLTVTEINGGNDIKIAFAQGGSITITNELSNWPWQLEQVKFANGTTWSYTQLVNQALTGGAGNDTLLGDDLADTLSGGGGNDSLTGRGGNDRLIGGAGNDSLYGNAGDDTFVFGRGDGQDVATEYDGNGGGFDTLELGPDIATTDLSFAETDNGQDFVLKINGTTDQITLDNTNTGNANYKFDQVRFADGTLWTFADLLAHVTAATSGNDNFVGDETANTLSGGAGNDSLTGRGGNDRLIGGAGNDSLYGNAGDDTFVFGLGDGQDVATEYDGNGGGFDTLEFGAGIASTDLSFAQTDNGQDWVLKINGTTDQITLDNTSTGNAGYRIDQVRFADGTVWSYADLFAHVTAATSGNDTIFGDETANALSGGGGNDVLDGRQGNDTVSGGLGNDTVQGGDGDDVYLYDAGDGDDVMRDPGSTSGGNDTIRLGAGIGTSDVTVTKPNGNDIKMTFVQGGSITITNEQANSAPWQIEQVSFSDGASWSLGELVNRVAGVTTVSTAADETFTATSATNTYHFSSTFGHDTVTGFATTGTAHDYIEVDRNQFSDWAHLLGATQQVGSDLVVTLDANNSVVLANVALSSFTQANAKFVN